MIAIDIANATFALPESWAEVIKHGKYLPVAETLYTRFESKDHAKVRLLEMLSGLTGYELGKLLKAATPAERQAAALQLSPYFALQVLEEIFPELEFLFTEVFTENPLPVVQCGALRLYGPADKLAKQTGAEMMATAWAYAEYVKTENPEYLHTLIALLYRPRWFYFTGPRATADALTAWLIKQVAKLPVPVKCGILLYYEMCEKWWRQTYAHLYDPDTSDNEAAEIDSLAVSRIVRSMAGAKRGTVEQVKLLTRDEIYFELHELKREADEAEKRSRK